MSPDNQSVQPEDEVADTPSIAQPANTDDISPEPPTEDEALAEQEEAPAPSTLHPSAPAGSAPDDEDIVKGKEEYGEYFIGMWHTKPNFGCPYCAFSTVEQGGNGLTELHILSMIESGSLPHMKALQNKGE